MTQFEIATFSRSAELISVINLTAEMTHREAYRFLNPQIFNQRFSSCFKFSLNIKLRNRTLLPLKWFEILVRSSGNNPQIIFGESEKGTFHPPTMRPLFMLN